MAAVFYLQAAFKTNCPFACWILCAACWQPLFQAYSLKQWLWI